MSEAAGNSTRERILSAAERLFAERGIDAVSLREITRASGSKNSISLQYHFENRDGVLQAIMDKHLPAVEALRHVMLDEIEAQADVDIRRLASALVRPIASKLADADGGEAFLQIYADLLDRPRPLIPDLGETASFDRWRKIVEPMLDPDAVRFHRRFIAILHTSRELARRSRLPDRNDDRLFISDLVDVVVGILSTPASPETRRERGTRRRVS